MVKDPVMSYDEMCRVEHQRAVSCTLADHGHLVGLKLNLINVSVILFNKL